MEEQVKEDTPLKTATDTLVSDAAAALVRS